MPDFGKGSAEIAGVDETALRHPEFPDLWQLSHTDWPAEIERIERWIELLDLSRQGDEWWTAAKAGAASLQHLEDAQLTEALVRATLQLAREPDLDGRARWYREIYAGYLLAATLVRALLNQGRVEDARQALADASEGNDGSASLGLGQLLSLTWGRLAAAEGQSRRAYSEYWNAVEWGTHSGSDPELVLEGLSELMALDTSDLPGVPSSSEWAQLVQLLAGKLRPGRRVLLT